MMLVALTLMMGLSMTSCLNSDSSGNMYNGWGFFRVESSMGGYFFSDPAGNSYVPTPASLASVQSQGFDISEADFAFFYFRWAEDETEAEEQLKDTTTTHTFDIELIRIAGFEEEETLVAQTTESMQQDAPETAPVISLKTTTTTGAVSEAPMLFDLDALLIPIYFNVGNTQEDLQQHKFVLACDMSEVEPGSTELNLYLRHDKGSDDDIEYYSASWYPFNLTSVVAEFKAKAGNAPTKLIIKAHEDINQSGKMPEEYTDYEIEYEDSAEQTSQN